MHHINWWTNDMLGGKRSWSIRDWKQYKCRNVSWTTGWQITICKSWSRFKSILVCYNSFNLDPVWGVPFFYYLGVVVANLALGQQHTCALRSDGKIVCWGSNSYGQLGIGNTITIGTSLRQMGSNLTLVDLGTGERLLLKYNRYEI